MYNEYSISRHYSLNDDAHIFKTPTILKSPGDILTIMMIDDNKKDMKLFEDLLRFESGVKFSLSKWTNSHDALAALEARQVSPDLIVLDLVMPCMNGKMILKYLKNLNHVKDIPVMIYSSMHNYENTMAVGQLEAHAFFAKPLNTELFEEFLLRK